MYIKDKRKKSWTTHLMKYAPCRVASLSFLCRKTETKIIPKLVVVVPTKAQCSVLKNIYY